MRKLTRDELESRYNQMERERTMFLQASPARGSARAIEAASSVRGERDQGRRTHGGSRGSDRKAWC